MKKACAMTHGLEEKRAFCINFIEDRVLSNVIYALIKALFSLLLSESDLRLKAINDLDASLLLPLLHKLY